jgi:hypothetical protein
MSDKNVQHYSKTLPPESSDFHTVAGILRRAHRLRQRLGHRRQCGSGMISSAEEK